MILHPKKAFTLIELLIVVAIIAVLAAIAVPNFLEAQTRSKISRTKSDMRTLATGITAYIVDQNQYPPNLYSYSNEPFTAGGKDMPYNLGTIDYRRGMTAKTCLWRVTTPIAYLASIDELGSPFWVNTGNVHYNWVFTNNGPSSSYILAGNTYWFVANKAGALPTLTVGRLRPEWLTSGMLQNNQTWYLVDPGPDKIFEEVISPPTSSAYPGQLAVPYDPTNGTVSRGEIMRGGA